MDFQKYTPTPKIREDALNILRLQSNASDRKILRMCLKHVDGLLDDKHPPYKYNDEEGIKKIQLI